MADALLDTTFLIDYHRGDPGAYALWQEIRDGSLEGSVSAVTVFELWVGGLGRTEELVYRSMLMALEEVPLSGRHAEAAALWIRGVPSQSREVLVRDALIAATAAARREPIYTRNVRDFRRSYTNVRTY